MDRVENPMLRPNKLIALLIYIALQFFIGSFLLIIVGFIYCSKNPNIDFATLIVVITGLTSEGIDVIEYQTAAAVVSSIGNLLVYIVSLIGVGFYMRNYLVDDFNKIKQKPLYLILFMIIGAIVFYGIAYGVDILISPFVGESANQTSIVNMIVNGGAIPMFIAVVICAPIVEELIYRKVIFEYLDKKPIWISYVVSVLCFMLPHMLTTSGSLTSWLVISIPYVVSAVMLAMLYHLSGKNIYVSWFAHFINNLVAFIMIMMII